MKKISKTKIIKLITLIAIVTMLVIATVYMIPIIKQLNTTEGQVQFKEKIQESGMIGPLILFGLEIAQVLLAVLPGEPIEVLAGICFGPIWGSIFLMISVFIITCAIYFLVKKYGRKFIYEFFPKEKVNKLENSKLFKDEKKIEIVMIILFLIPATPKDLLVYIGGLLPIKSSRFILISTLLRFPSIISSVIAGDNILGGEWKIGVLAYVVTFLITFIVVFIVNKIDKNKVTEDIIESIKNNEIE
ncbi:MAG: TVP38/TMEM64 family protein [Clostridia bacterium]|nr:TVP38/TMEM64 family protein [Clostridia bacterium]